MCQTPSERTNGVYQESNLVNFRLKMWHLVAIILMIFLIINWRNFVFIGWYRIFIPLNFYETWRSVPPPHRMDAPDRHNVCPFRWSFFYTICLICYLQICRSCRHLQREIGNFLRSTWHDVMVSIGISQTQPFKLDPASGISNVHALISVRTYCKVLRWSDFRMIMKPQLNYQSHYMIGQKSYFQKLVQINCNISRWEWSRP